MSIKDIIILVREMFAEALSKKCDGDILGHRILSEEHRKLQSMIDTNSKNDSMGISHYVSVDNGEYIKDLQRTVSTIVKIMNTTWSSVINVRSQEIIGYHIKMSNFVKSESIVHNIERLNDQFVAFNVDIHFHYIKKKEI